MPAARAGAGLQGASCIHPPDVPPRAESVLEKEGVGIALGNQTKSHMKSFDQRAVSICDVSHLAFIPWESTMEP